MTEITFKWNFKRPGETDGSEGLHEPVGDPRFQEKIIVEGETHESSPKGSYLKVLFAQLRNMFKGLPSDTFKFDWIRKSGNQDNTEEIPVPHPTDEQVAMFSEKKLDLIEEELAEPIPTNHDTQTYGPKEQPDD